MKRSFNHLRMLPAARRGITLIELLVVIVILSIVTAASIPMLTSGMEQRRVREAARLVSSYISSAKSRAVETGRPSGVMIQRYTPAAITASGGGGGLQSLPGYAMSLVMVDIPAPYSGDTTGSMAIVSTQLISGINYGTAYNNMTLTCAIVTNLGYGTISGSPPTFPAPDSAWTGLVRAGDLIRFGNQGRWYMILGTCATTPTNPSTAVPLNSSVAVGSVITGQPQWTASGTAQAPWVIFAIDGSGATPSVNAAGTSYTAGAGAIYPYQTFSYQILRQPVKSAVPPLQLPEGVVIDLENSGVGINSWYSGGNNWGISWYLGGNFNGTSGNTTMPLYPNPIITFYPTGQVGFIYQGFNPPQHLTSALYLLVGRRDGMSDVNQNNGVSPYYPTNMITDPSTGLPLDPNSLPNLYDMTNLWVAISPQSGLVVTTENANMLMGIAAMPPSFTPSDPQAAQYMYPAARAFAQSATSMGGK